MNGARVLVLGLTFKENCPDLRNSKVVDMVKELEKYGAKVDVYDPWVGRPRGAPRVRNQARARACVTARYDAIVMAVAHDEFREMGVARASQALGKKEHVLYDIKYVFRADQVDGRL